MPQNEHFPSPAHSSQPKTLVINVLLNHMKLSFLSVKHDWIVATLFFFLGSDFFSLFFKKIFIYLHWVLVVSCGIFHYSPQIL